MGFGAVTTESSIVKDVFRNKNIKTLKSSTEEVATEDIEAHKETPYPQFELDLDSTVISKLIDKAINMKYSDDLYKPFVRKRQVNKNFRNLIKVETRSNESRQSKKSKQ